MKTIRAMLPLLLVACICSGSLTGASARSLAAVNGGVFGKLIWLVTGRRSRTSHHHGVHATIEGRDGRQFQWIPQMRCMFS